jgi:aspartyl-tRNA(Asn)/glutamyl-tRNA(Gln) amidotransferase subunit A
MDGRRFGKKIEDSAGDEVLRRLAGGSEISKAEFEGQYYHKALAVKELIKKEFERVLESVDFIVMPTTPFLPWKFGTKIDLEKLYAVDALTIPGNLAEICAILLQCHPKLLKRILLGILMTFLKPTTIHKFK